MQYVPGDKSKSALPLTKRLPLIQSVFSRLQLLACDLSAGAGGASYFFLTCLLPPAPCPLPLVNYPPEASDSFPSNFNAACSKISRKMPVTVRPRSWLSGLRIKRWGKAYGTSCLRSSGMT